MKEKKKNLLISDDYDLKMAYKSLVFANIAENCLKTVAHVMQIGREFVYVKIQNAYSYTNFS
ncbi:hypothetical protein [Bacillus sp. TL12]|uniref:hypothetical protein n=1 Tax=Bacillus sp. TL12 TaxID=2894756 RepID=UPI001F5218C7|nr:hypothetical protein [Bacillus sp. TL12]MCI0764772.1 hypothetical protein [Bacillus sp. TL12]